MAVIRVKPSGGVYPAMSARDLGVNDAQVAVNLLALADEFRPLANDTVVVASSGVSNPQTIYRLSRVAGGGFSTNMTTGWRVHADPVYYVKGQINDEATERTYYTTASAAPRATDSSGQDRQLGVPKPTTSPGVTVVATYTYTSDERDKDLIGSATAVRDAIKNAATEVWIGDTTIPTGAALPAAVTNAPATGSELMYRMYALGAAGTVTDAYSTVAAEKFGWVFDSSLGGAGPRTVAGFTGNQHCIGYHGRARTYKLVDTAALKGVLLAIKRPLADPPENLLDTARVDKMVVEIEKAFASSAELTGMVSAHKTKRSEVEALLAGGQDAAIVSQVRAFYAKATTQTAITAAIDSFAKSVFNAASNAAVLPVNPYPTETGAGA